MIPLENLVSQGLVNVDYPDKLRMTIEKSVTSWFQFCSLPREVKKSFIYVDDGNIDGSGYELKEEKASTKDLKENFHVTLNAYEQLAQTAKLVDYDQATRFIFDAQDVIASIRPLILDFAESLENQIGIPGLLEEVRQNTQNWILRYLHYFGDRRAGEEIASAHADKSGFTLHLYESWPGLQYLEFGKSRQWKEMPVSQGKTVIISNMQLQYKSKGKLKALCHRVVATHATARVGRHSVVCFIPFCNTPLYNKSAKGRIQEFSPGFNYDMPDEEFSQLFA